MIINLFLGVHYNFYLIDDNNGEGSSSQVMGTIDATQLGWSKTWSMTGQP